MEPLKTLVFSFISLNLESKDIVHLLIIKGM